MFHPDRVATESFWGSLSGIRANQIKGPSPTCLRKSNVNTIAVEAISWLELVGQELAD
ncbi:unnamed protein product [Penicillium roqueforti FM164]|uniref:Genomic scaffold, ProqFM164S02 n=1 Tax=Penicillium roqueforti (strain FM164) TaxID=1365484 RepID=W6Q940_PENRF|nr:unnamed protein product [Penicillium roqueforti FM164]